MAKSLVDRNGWKFLEQLAKWIGLAIPATYVNSMIKVTQSLSTYILTFFLK